MFIVTSTEMRRLDQQTIEEIGLPAAVLLERAGQALAEEAAALLNKRRAQGDGMPERILVLAGKGNNGGDGMVAVRHLCERSIACDLLLAEPPERLTAEAARQYAVLLQLGIAGEIYAGGAAGQSRVEDPKAAMEEEVGERATSADIRDTGTDERVSATTSADIRQSGADERVSATTSADVRQSGADERVSATTSADVRQSGAEDVRAAGGMSTNPMSTGGAALVAGSNVPWHRYGLIVDALLGTGTSGAPREPYASLIREAAESGLPVIAADIPSGLDADTGETYEPCLRADRTVSFAFLKRGQLLYPGAAAAGEVVVRTIGIPERLAAEAEVPVALLTEEVLRERLQVEPSRSRRPDTHKGSYGHTLVVAGSLRMSGAGLLCARGALRAGSGLVTWAVPESLAPHLLGRVPEAMLAGVTDAGLGDWAATSAEDVLALATGRSALALGPGMGRYAGDGEWLRAIWEGAPCPLVLDADALNMLAAAGDFAEWPKRRSATVLTPHPGEMARMAGVSTREVQRDRIGLAQHYAKDHDVVLVLKGAGTIIAVPNGRVWINPTGNPGMATGGSGDVLAGVIAGLLAQGLSAEQAAAFGVWLHGAAGDRAAAKRTSAASLTAGDLLEEL